MDSIRMKTAGRRVYTPVFKRQEIERLLRRGARFKKVVHGCHRLVEEAT